MRILIIEDDLEMAHSIRDVLKKQYAVDLASTGTEGEYQAFINEYDLIILDLNLPDIKGIQVCQLLRDNDIKAPVLMLTGQNQVDDKVQALDAGADDYLTKPFEPAELQARIRALLRRNSRHRSTTLSLGDLTIDTATHAVTRGEQVIHLRRKEFQLLEYLLSNTGRTITRSMIMQHIWDSSRDPVTNTVDVHIKYLRDRIDKGFPQKLIKTVYGLGYKIEN